MSRSRPKRLIHVLLSVLPDSTDLDQLEAQGLDLAEHTVQRGLIRKRTGQYGVAAVGTRAQRRKRREDALAQQTPDSNCVSDWLVHVWSNLHARAGVAKRRRLVERGLLGP
jgi:hypothetical protein